MQTRTDCNDLDHYCLLSRYLYYNFAS